MSEVPTLYEWAGGRAAIEAMIGCWPPRESMTSIRVSSQAGAGQPGDVDAART
jgi:hypothetical protein